VTLIDFYLRQFLFVHNLRHFRYTVSSLSNETNRDESSGLSLFVKPSGFLGKINKYEMVVKNWPQVDVQNLLLLLSLSTTTISSSNQETQ